jgi:hypothetical protein
MNTTEPHVHAVPKEAEAAAAAAVAPHIAGIKVVILALMKTAGDAGLIASEVPGLINTVRRRFVDLQKDGLIKPNGQTRANERGKLETVYVLGKDEKSLGAAAKIHANALRDARGAVAWLSAEYLDGRGVPGIIGWGTCMLHLLDKAKARVAELQNPATTKKCCKGWGNGHWINAANECHALSSQPGDRWESLA